MGERHGERQWTVDRAHTNMKKILTGCPSERKKTFSGSTSKRSLKTDRATVGAARACCGGSDIVRQTPSVVTDLSYGTRCRTTIPLCTRHAGGSARNPSSPSQPSPSPYTNFFIFNLLPSVAGTEGVKVESGFLCTGTSSKYEVITFESHSKRPCGGQIGSSAAAERC